MRLMRFALRLLALPLLFPLLTQCGTKTAPETNVVTGPFDSQGNYIEDWADEPDKWHRPTTPSEKKKPITVFAKKETSPPPEIVVVQPLEPVRTRPDPVVSKSAPKPAPKPVAKPQPKPKPKPVTVSHTVKKGDTLSGLARKYGSTVSKIQSANGIKGSVIRLGQTLTIPK